MIYKISQYRISSNSVNLKCPIGSLFLTPKQNTIEIDRCFV
jgi:hypothetical protein